MIHISKFIDRIKSFESRGIKDFTMPLQDAKDLHSDITKLLLQLQQNTGTQSNTDDVIEIEIKAPGFKD